MARLENNVVAAVCGSLPGGVVRPADCRQATMWLCAYFELETVYSSEIQGENHHDRN